MTLRLDTPLQSAGTFTASQVVAAITSHTPRTPYSDAEVRQIVERTIYWCGVTGFNHDLVLSQMIHETDWFRFTGDVQPEQYNFAGLGATGGVPGHSFPTIEAGVMAVVFHHAVYRWGSKEKWPAHLQQYAGDQVDPRYSAVLSTGNAGKMIVLGDYRGTWAVPGHTYPESLVTRSRQIAVFPRGEESMSAQIPGFTWHPADSDHYQRGRTERIRGIAIHYTAGTSSLRWLTETSVPPVSATFLIKPDATMSDRGWQMVRIEDTPWTTAFANAYTASVEVEHDGNGPLPAHLYPIIAQTVIDIAEYVERKNLGFVPLDRTGVKPHKEWVNNPALICSDGVDTNRVVAVIQDLREVAPPEDALLLPANPFGEIPVVLGFKGLYLDAGKAKYPDNPVLGGLSLFGYPESEEFPTAFGSAQVFERAVFKYFKDVARPWDLVIAHRTEPIPERRDAA